MNLKNGEPIPASLATALAENAYAAAVFALMRPSCQTRYAEHISEAISDEIQSRRALAAVEQITKYGLRHGL